MIVLDTSAACEIANETDLGKALQSLILVDEKIVSCNIMRIEIASVFRKLIALKKLDINIAKLRYHDTLALVDQYYPIEELELEAFTESARLNHSTYDMLYFVLARRLAATLLTTDRKLMALCDKHGVNCVQLIDF